MYHKIVRLDDLLGTGFDTATDSLKQLRDNQDLVKAKTDQLIFTGTELNVNVQDKGILNDVSTSDVSSSVISALDTAIGGSPTTGSINERVKALDDNQYWLAQVIASDNLIQSNDTEADHNFTVYEPCKIISIGVSGLYRVKFDLKVQTPYTGKGQIFKNGVAHGTERTTNLGTYTTYSEDLYFVAGDLLQLEIYISVGGVTHVYARNLQLYGDISMGFANIME